MCSHVLLAACRHDELAWESLSPTGNTTRGVFTSCLVKHLYQEDLNRVSYSALLDLLPRLEHQHPQCEGKNKGRAFFSGTVDDHQVTFRLFKDGEEYRAEAGDIHGVVEGTLFAIHPRDMISATDKELGILAAISVDGHSCSLGLRAGDAEFDIPTGARALVLNWRKGKIGLKVAVQPGIEEVQSVEHVFSRVGLFDNPDVVVRRTSATAFDFERLDPLISKWAQVLSDFKPKFGLSDVLRGVSRFNFHLYRHNSANPLRGQVKVVLHRLKRSNVEGSFVNPVYVPDRNTEILLQPDHELTVQVPAQQPLLNRVFHGLTVQNFSDRNLFPYLIYFDPSDYSIQVSSGTWMIYHAILMHVCSPGITRHHARWLHHLLLDSKTANHLSCQSVTDQPAARLWSSSWPTA